MRFWIRWSNQIDPGGSGDLLTRFLHINRDLRKKNNQTLSDLRLKTEERVLWNGPFLQLANSQVESHFSLIYGATSTKGRKIDEQVHLGYDLAAHATRPSDRGERRPCGVGCGSGTYGNRIVVDHITWIAIDSRTSEPGSM